VRVGDTAAAFTLTNQHGEAVSIGQFAGVKNVALVFFPYAFSGVCTSELAELSESLDEISRTGTELLAVSCDHMFSLRAYADRDRYRFSLLSDFWPHGAVAGAYAAFDDERGCPRRSTVVVDRAGIVCWRADSGFSQARSLGDLREFLYGLE
jgi:peroxiredoxin